MSDWHALMRRHGVRSSKGRAANGNVIFATFPHDTATSKWYVKIRAQKSERETKDGSFFYPSMILKLNQYSPDILDWRATPPLPNTHIWSMSFIAYVDWMATIARMSAHSSHLFISVDGVRRRGILVFFIFEARNWMYLWSTYYHCKYKDKYFNWVFFIFIAENWMFL